ncbi:MAG: polysaccharide lyase 6 family protein, partial [Puniceicoccales bacterium]
KQTLRLKGRGTEEARVTVRAESPGEVTLNAPVLLTGTYLSLEGFDFGEKSRLEFTEGTGHRVLGCRFDALQAGHWVRFNDEATHCEIGYCSFTNDNNAGEKSNQQIVQIKRSDATGPDYHRIHHNYFANVSPGETNNGFETIQVHQGTVGALGSSHTVIEKNVFEACNGEAEMISIKCSDNVIRDNLIIACRGSIVLRKGTGNLVEGNVFLGDHGKGTGGVRFRGDDQVVINNFFYQLAYSAIAMHNGDAGNYYEPVTRATVAFNTIVDCGRVLNIGIRHPKHDSSILPTGVVFANNIIVGEGAQIYDPDGAMATWTLEGNIVYGMSPELITLPGFTVVDPELVLLPSGILAPAEGSPAIGQAQGDFPQVTIDIFGNPRPETGKTIGAVEQAIRELPVSHSMVGPDALP